MSLSEMARLVNCIGLAKSNAQWCPKWIEAYARSVHPVDAPRIDISRESLILLPRRMRDSGQSAWVRLQVVRAVEFYQKSVLRRSRLLRPKAPSALKMIPTLLELGSGVLSGRLHDFCFSSMSRRYAS